jgi:hypothetical protein
MRNDEWEKRKQQGGPCCREDISLTSSALPPVEVALVGVTNHDSRKIDSNIEETLLE